VSDNPFSHLFGDLMRMLGHQGPNAWFDSATQLALTIARGEDGDPNPLPTERQRVEELAALVARRVDALFGVVGGDAVTAVNRTALSLAVLEQWRPLLEPLVSAAPSAPVPAAEGLDEAGLAQMMASLGPLFTGFQMGSVAGHFSESAWSLAALALPRLRPERLLAVNNLATFADAWSLERDEVYAFALAQEFTASAILSQPGTGDALRALLLDGVRESAAHQGDLMERLAGLDPSEAGSLFNDPSSWLEGLEPPDESPATIALNAATAALGAVFDATATQVTEALLGPRPALVEAYRRHRRSDARGEDAAAALFGISLEGPHHESAEEFVRSLADAHGLGVFDALLRVDGLPSASELESPEAWLERVRNSPLA
jgi:uncharacterized protein (DUF2342 family)